MEATAQNGGLIGLAGSVRKHASSAASFVSNPDRLAIYLVFLPVSSPSARRPVLKSRNT